MEDTYRQVGRIEDVLYPVSVTAIESCGIPLVSISGQLNKDGMLTVNARHLDILIALLQEAKYKSQRALRKLDETK